MTGRTFFPQDGKGHTHLKKTQGSFLFRLFVVQQPETFLTQDAEISTCTLTQAASSASLVYQLNILTVSFPSGTFPTSALLLIIILRNLHFVSFDFISFDNQSRFSRQLLSRLGCSSISPFPREFSA